MAGAQYDLTAIGLPFIDLIAQVDDAFLDRFGFAKGTAQDYPPARLLAARAELIDYAIYPGGSPSNTCAGIDALGGKAVFLGRVCDDTIGRTFRAAFLFGGVVFPNQPYGNDSRAVSGLVIVMITPDDATTIAAWPGVGDMLTEADIFPELIENSEILYTQCHFMQIEPARLAIGKAIEHAKSAGREVAFSLHGNRFNAERAANFREQHLTKADILMGNRREFDLLYRPFVFDDAIQSPKLMVVTDGAMGAHILGRGGKLHIPPYLLKARDNTVGAGDAFAAGFYFGYIPGWPLQACGELGAEAASAILEIPGARPVGSWKSMVGKYFKLSSEARV